MRWPSPLRDEDATVLYHNKVLNDWEYNVSFCGLQKQTDLQECSLRKTKSF